MTDTKDTIVSFPLPEQNIVQNFILNESSIRGRVVRFGSLLDDIINPHDLPEPIQRIMAEAITLSTILSSMLKYEGTFILQIQGDGALKMLVCDVNSEGDVRGYVNYNQEKYGELVATNDKPSITDMLGKGYLAFTVDQGKHAERYQGIVAIEGDSLEESVQHYFEQSEQVETVLRMAVNKDDDGWHTGGIMIQRMPLSAEIVQNEVKDKEDEDWVRSSILLKTCKDNELLDEKLDEGTLLLRLFHEEGVIVLDTKVFKAKCKCSEERLLGVLATMPKDDISHIVEDGKISMTCEFCKTIYAIVPPDELL